MDKPREHYEKAQVDTFPQLCWNKPKATGCTAETEALLPTHIWALMRTKRINKFDSEDLVAPKVAPSLLLHKILCHRGCTEMLWAHKTSPIHLFMSQKVSGKPRWNTTKHGNTDRGVLFICFTNGKCRETNVNQNKLQEVFCNLKLTI